MPCVGSFRRASTARSMLFSPGPVIGMSKQKPSPVSGMRSSSPANFATSSPKLSHKRQGLGSPWTSPAKGGDGVGSADQNGEGLGTVIHNVAAADAMRSHGSPLLSRSQKMDRSAAESDIEAAAAVRALENLADRYGSLSRHAALTHASDYQAYVGGASTLGRSDPRGSLGRLNAAVADVADERQAAPDNRFGSLDRTAAMRHYGYRDRSLERSGEYSHSSRVQRNRSLDRDYPLLAVSSRSLERCAADDGQQEDMPLRYQGQSQSLLIVKLQTQLLELGKELTDCQKELEQNKSQLNSYIASVKTFWSPELKKERASRKDESAKAARFAEQLRQLQNDKQICQVRIQNLEDRLNLVGLREEVSAASGSGTTVAEVAVAKRERERLEKEVVILRKTVDEMELRIDIQRKTLAARDASVKKLVEMLQSKVASGGSGSTVANVLDGEAERDQLRKEVAALEQRLQQTEEGKQEASSRASKLQEALDTSRAELKEAQANLNRMTRDSKHFEDVQGLLDLKAARIAELESEIKSHQIELAQLRNSSQQSSEDRQHLEALHSHEKLLKSKIENMKADLATKANEAVTLKNRIEALETQNVDFQQHVDVLKQHVETKAKSLEMQQHEIHDLDAQVKEKAAAIEKKSVQIESLKAEKLRLEGESAELRLESEAKSRKLATVEKKVTSLEQQLLDRSAELDSARTSLSSLLLQSTSSSTAVASLEDALSERDRIIDRLKREKEDTANEHATELAATEEAAKDLKQRVNVLERELADKQVELLELQGELSELRADKLKQDSRLHQLECNHSQAARELDELRSAYDKLADERSSQAENVARLRCDVEAAQREVERSSEQSANAQNEVERLLDIIKTMEADKHTKDSQIHELTEQLKEAKQRYASARRSQHIEKLPNNGAGGADEGKQSSADGQEGGKTGGADSKTSVSTQQLEERVEELEEALRQSVRITAERELVLAEQRRHLERSEKQLAHARTEVSVLRAYDRSEQTRELEEALREKDEQLRKMASERARHTEEAYEMKQEAILAAISEKDTHIALLETSKSKTAREEIEKLNHEKRKLNDKLKELTRQRMLLVVERSSDNARKLASAEEQRP